jgi:tetratricopeptide (TPR) repeat protein
LLLLALVLSILVPTRGAQAPRAIFERAAADLGAGRYAEAEQGFLQILRDEPQHLGALGNLGIVYSRTGRAEKAIEVYQQALRLAPSDPGLLLNLGLVYAKQERYEDALPLFARIVEAQPSHNQAQELLATCEIYTGREAAAVTRLEALRAKNPRAGSVLYWLGVAQLRRKEPEQAQRVFQELFQTAASPAQAKLLLGKAYYESTLFDEAVTAFREVIAIDPNFPLAHLELGKAYLSQRLYDEARQLVALFSKAFEVRRVFHGGPRFAGQVEDFALMSGHARNILF